MSKDAQRRVLVEGAEALGFVGRAPVLEDWILDRDLLLPDSDAGYASVPERIAGVQGGDGWVLFHRLQVIQIVPEEVHSYWHRELAGHEDRGSGWRIDNSSWLASFAQQHLSRCKHYVIEFYDDLVEVICEALIFGDGEFSLPNVLPKEPRLSYAHFRRAVSLKKQGRLSEALAEWENYLASKPHDSLEYAERCATSIRVEIILGDILGDETIDPDDQVEAILAQITTHGWPGVRAALLGALYDDTRGAWWRACMEAHERALADDHDLVSADNLIALAYHRLDAQGQDADLVQRLVHDLKPNSASPYDPLSDPRVARELSRLRGSREEGPSASA